MCLDILGSRDEGIAVFFFCSLGELYLGGTLINTCPNMSLEI